MDNRRETTLAKMNLVWQHGTVEAQEGTHRMVVEEMERREWARMKQDEEEARRRWRGPIRIYVRHQAQAGPSTPQTGLAQGSPHSPQWIWHMVVQCVLAWLLAHQGEYLGAYRDM